MRTASDADIAELLGLKPLEGSVMTIPEIETKIFELLKKAEAGTTEAEIAKYLAISDKWLTVLHLKGGM